MRRMEAVSGLMPDEAVLKDSGGFPVAYTKNIMRTINGRLPLTNMRLVFAGGYFQDILESLLTSYKERVEIPLNSIAEVNKGFGAKITIVSSTGKYTFGGMLGAKDWVSAYSKPEKR